VRADDKTTWSLHGWTTSLPLRLLVVVPLVASGNRCSSRTPAVSGMLTIMSIMAAAGAGYLVTSAGDDAPVGTTKVAVAQRVANWIDRTVDVAQPVT